MRTLELLFDTYGRLVARHPLPFLLVPCLTTLASLLGVPAFHSEDNIWDLYAPTNAFSRVEEKELKTFERAVGMHHHKIQIVVSRKVGGSPMNKADLAEIADVDMMITDNYSIALGGEDWTYSQLCSVYCRDQNSVLLEFVETALDQSSDEAQQRVLPFTFTYPVARAVNMPLFAGFSVGELEMDANGTRVAGFGLFILHYMIDLHLPNGQQISHEFEAQLLELSEQATKESARLDYALLSRERELEEQKKISTTSVPYLFVTGAVLTAFMLATLIDIPLYKSQHIEAIFGVVSPAMALVTTFGLLWGVGLPFSNILTVVPFLTLVIGIDDAFLILAGWRHSRSLDLETRMGECLAKSGASIAVTTLTDVLCFGVGFFSSLPIVRLFCVYTSVALAIDFIYQITFFLAVCCYCGERQLNEIKARAWSASATAAAGPSISHCSSSTSSINTINTMASMVERHLAPTASRQHAEEYGAVVVTFVDVLHRGWVQFVVLSTFAAHLVAAVYCCTLVNTDFRLENLYLHDSPLNPVAAKMQKFLLNESFVVNFVVRDVEWPKSFAERTTRSRFNAMIRDLEQMAEFGFGSSVGARLWTRDYEDVVKLWVSRSGEEQDGRTGAMEAQMWEESEVLRNFRRMQFDERLLLTKIDPDGREVIDSFTWLITYHHMKDFLDVERMLETRRSILKAYSPWFTVYSHHPFEKVPTESAASAPRNFIQTGVTAVLLMSVLVFFFVWNLEAILIVVLSIVSISVGTVGYLHLLGVNLDAVSLISTLMSIGFSVDYSAHCCYHFYTNLADSGTSVKEDRTYARQPQSLAEENDKLSTCNSTSSIPRKRHECRTRPLLMSTLNAVGWPVLQAGLSTTLGILPLVFVDAYLVAVFWKTIILVTALGVFHALFLLPVIFISLEQMRNGCWGSGGNKVAPPAMTPDDISPVWRESLAAKMSPIEISV